MCRVVNKYKEPFDIYIGRGSIWGNDEQMTDSSDSERQRVIECYRNQLWSQIKSGIITKQMLLDLQGKTLGCFCKPKSCHGDILVKAVQWACSYKLL